MQDIEICPECGVPVPFNQGLVWLNNGDIVQRANAGARMAFIECENLDPLFENIGDIIGMPIDDIVINISTRGAKVFISRMIPKEVKDLARNQQMDLSYFIDAITAYCQIIGYGKYEFLDYSYNKQAEDYAVMRITEPFSILEAAGAFAGAIAGVMGGEIAVSYEEESPGEFLLTARWTEYPEVLKEKLALAEYRHTEGGIELACCRTCGAPRAFSGYRWSLADGIIRQNYTGRRMAMLGPENLDPVFKALEEELGETIPQVVIEAQRRFVKTGFYSLDILESEADLRTQLALRGLGNLREFQISRRGASLRLDNACLHLLLAGLIQGNFEMTFDVESDLEWVLTVNGDLELEIAPKRTKETMGF